MILALISGESALNAFIWFAVVSLVVVGLIVWILLWFIGYCGLPEPFNKIARILIALVAVVFLINCLLGLTGGPHYHW